MGHSAFLRTPTHARILHETFRFLALGKVSHVTHLFDHTALEVAGRTQHRGLGDQMDHVKSELDRIAGRARMEVMGLSPIRAVLHAANTLPSFALGCVRTSLLRLSGIKIAERSCINGRVFLTGPGFRCDLVSIGTNTIISGPLHLDVGAEIVIGCNVRIGHNVSIHTIGHEIGGAGQRAGQHETGPVVIEDGVWICSHAVILPGVTVGRGSVVAAGALVSRDVAPNKLVGGVPARVLRELPPEAERGSEAPPTLNSLEQPNSGMISTNKLPASMGHVSAPRAHSA